MDLPVSTNFGVSNGKLGLDFLLSRSVERKSHLHETAGGSWGSPHFSTAPIARNTENPRFFKDGC